MLPKKLGDFIAIKPFAHKKDSVQSVVVSGFLGATNLLLNGNLHDFIVFNGQSFHSFALQNIVFHPERHFTKCPFILQYLCRCV